MVSKSLVKSGPRNGARQAVQGEKTDLQALTAVLQRLRSVSFPVQGCNTPEL